MNSYREYLDAQEKNCMTEDEILEKRNKDILSYYTTAGQNITPQSVMPETVNTKPEKCKK